MAQNPAAGKSVAGVTVFTNAKIFVGNGREINNGSLVIENGKINSPEITKLLHNYLQPMISQNIDYLVLGCSHYPYLIPQIKKILPKNIQIIDSGEAVAKQTKTVLQEKVGMRNITAKSAHQFYTNANQKVLSDILKNKFQVISKDF